VIVESFTQGRVLGTEIRDLTPERIDLAGLSCQRCLECVELRQCSVASALGRQRSPTFGRKLGLDIAQRLDGGRQLGLQRARSRDGECKFVAVGERLLERRRLLVTSLPRAVGPDTVGVGPPLAWPTTLAGNRHVTTVTKRNGWTRDEHQRMASIEESIALPAAGASIAASSDGSAVPASIRCR
jgi:hypothetical protein